jgi:hypothetical protein
VPARRVHDHADAGQAYRRADDVQRSGRKAAAASSQRRDAVVLVIGPL